MKKKYRSCNLIQHGLCFFDDALVSCCYSPVDQINGQRPPALYDGYKGEILSKEELFSRIDKYANIFKCGGTPAQCTNCYKIEEKEWEEYDNQYIDFVTVTHYSNCNADCVYCSNNLRQEDRSNDKYKVFPFLKKLKDEGVLRKGFELHIGGGEFSIYEECDALIEEFALTNYAKVCIATNAIKYKENIAKALNKGNNKVVISLDSGCRETFKKVKRIDAFETVVENIKKYADADTEHLNLTLKYIIIPTVNDNFNEFKKFIELTHKLGVKFVSIDIEARYSRSVNHHIDYYYYELFKKMKDYAEKSKYFYGVFVHSFMEQDREFMKEYENKPIKKLVSRIKTKLNTKNIQKLYTSHKY